MPGKGTSHSSWSETSILYGMPAKWCKYFVQAGKSQLQVQQTHLICYFHMQEKMAISKPNNKIKKDVMIYLILMLIFLKLLEVGLGLGLGLQ